MCVKLALCIYTCAYVYLCVISHREQMELGIFTALFGSLWPCHVCANAAAKLTPISSLSCQPQLHCGTLCNRGNRWRSKRRLVSERECKEGSLFFFSPSRFVVFNQPFMILNLVKMFKKRNTPVSAGLLHSLGRRAARQLL